MKVTIKSLPHEVFKAVEDSKNDKERIAILQNCCSFATKTILQLNFNKKINLDLPSGTPPYREDEAPAGLARAPINKQITILGRLLPGNKLPPIKREALFIRCLEGLNAKDSEAIVAAKDGVLSETYPSLTEALIKKALPAILK